MEPDAPQRELIELLDRVAASGDLPTDDDAMAAAVEEVRSVRAQRRTNPA
ncbi:hypothetical protein [Sporichthya polymorpha]|nr:hypothetical protein [Sporichthya polymorpha]